jgi:hypothetical protein
MNRDLRDRLFGSGDRDPGCEGAFEMLDQYCDAVGRGEDADRRFPEFVTHIRNCAACREDTQALLAAIDDPERARPER